MVALTDDMAKCAFIADILKAVGHPMRLRIVALLCESDQHVGALATRLGAAHAAVSQQLSVLRGRRLVEKRNENGRAVYRLAEPRLRELVCCMRECQVR